MSANNDTTSIEPDYPILDPLDKIMDDARIKPPRGPRKKPGPRKTKLDTTDIFKLASYGNSMGDIADLLGMSPATIAAEYGDVFREGASCMRRTLRRKQIEVALNDDSRHQGKLLTHLGRYYLDQRDDKIQDPVSDVETVDFDLIEPEQD